MIKVTRVEVDDGRTIKVFINEQSNLDSNEEDNNLQ